jgi:hypothetical protein
VINLHIPQTNTTSASWASRSSNTSIETAAKTKAAHSNKAATVTTHEKPPPCTGKPFVSLQIQDMHALSCTEKQKTQKP